MKRVANTTLDEMIGKFITESEIKNVAKVYATDAHGVRVEFWPTPEYRDTEYRMTTPIRTVVETEAGVINVLTIHGDELHH